MPTFTQIASQSRAGNGIFLIPRDDASHSGNRTLDQAVTESIGPIVDRTAEHLGAADTAIIVMRHV